MGKEQAVKLMAEKVSQLRTLFDECVTLADQEGIKFEMPWGGEGTRERGIGGVYCPTQEIADNLWYDYAQVGWNSSSGVC